MIGAVARLAEYDAAPIHEKTRPDTPVLLAEYWRFMRYGLAPNAGGQRDQPAAWFERAETLHAAYTAWAAWLKSPKTAEWMANNERTFQTVRTIMDVLNE